jgi:dolichol-phosphate mannosyltransferase
MNTQPIKYTLVIPLKDEEHNIAPLLEEIEPIMHSLNEPWEVLCIEDGSTDGTLEVLEKLKQTKPYLKVLIFSSNFGQSSAFDAGFKEAQGDFIITLDGDRQNDPSDIPKLLSYVQNYDLVCGIRAQRKDGQIKKITSLIANAVRSRVCGDGVQDTGCSLKVYRKSCLRKIKMYQGMHRFLPALFQIEGFRVGELPVNHRPRTAGKTKYNFLNRSFNTIIDMLAVRWMKKRHLAYKIKQKLP